MAAIIIQTTEKIIALWQNGERMICQSSVPLPMKGAVCLSILGSSKVKGARKMKQKRNTGVLPTKYPLLLVHGMGFRDNNRLNYWGRIPRKLKEENCAIYYGGQDGNGTIEKNAEKLKCRIEEILEETGAEKVNIIAHSKGGLDVRYAISTLGMGDKVASVTTISTPHHGSKTVDLLLKMPDCFVRFAAICANVWLRICGDKNPDTYQVFHSLTTESAAVFNQNNPDNEKVYYQSYAFVMKNSFSDILLFLPHFVVKLIEGENDGLLSPRAVQWGVFKGLYKSNSNRGISHCDEVDLRRRRLTKKLGEGISDMVDFYINVVRDLQRSGF